MAKINEKKFEFKWNVWTWDINRDVLETYDVVPMFLREWNSLKDNDRPKNKKEFMTFLKNEAAYHFWAKCEYEVIVHAWPKFKNDIKVDVYQQLMLNWDCFANAFWKRINSVMNADHRKQRGRTAPNRALKK